MEKATLRKQAGRYSEIETALRSAIENGQYKVGDFVPTEHTLCEQFSASRFTVRQALARLREQGLVEARAGIGTIVVSTEKREPFIQTLNSTEELLQYPSETWRKQLGMSRIKADAGTAVMLRCSIGQEWIKQSAMRIVRKTDLPISWLEIYLAPRYADILDVANPTGEPVWKQIERHYGYRASHAQVEISVAHIGPDLAEPLKTGIGTPGMVILRRYQSENGEIYLVTYSLHPENRFSLNIEFERQQV